jgi:hypothetical protein
MTYDEIKQLPNYKKLISYGLKDTTGPIQVKRLSIEFTKPFGLGREKQDKVVYVAYANGAVRKGKERRGVYSTALKLNPIKTYYGGLKTLDDYDKAFGDIIMNFEGIRKTPDKIRKTDTDKIEYFMENFPKQILIQILEQDFIWTRAKYEQQKGIKNIISALYIAVKPSADYLRSKEK